MQLKIGFRNLRLILSFSWAIGIFTSNLIYNHSRDVSSYEDIGDLLLITLFPFILFWIRLIILWLLNSLRSESYTITLNNYNRNVLFGTIIASLSCAYIAVASFEQKLTSLGACEIKKIDLGNKADDKNLNFIQWCMQSKGYVFFPPQFLTSCYDNPDNIDCFR